MGGRLPGRLHVADTGGRETQATSRGLMGVYKHWPSLNNSFLIFFDLTVEVFWGFFAKNIIICFFWLSML